MVCWGHMDHAGLGSQFKGHALVCQELYFCHEELKLDSRERRYLHVS